MLSDLWTIFKWLRPYLSFQLIVGLMPVLISLTVWRLMRWIQKPTFYSLKYPKIRLKGRRRADDPYDVVQGWIPIWVSEELPENKICYGTLYERDYVIFRKPNDQQVQVMDAYCPHLGAHLAFGGELISSPDTKSTCIRCPFHGWQYDCDSGKIVSLGVVNTDLMDDQNLCTTLPNVSVRVWTSVELHGIVYVWYHCQEPKPTWSLTSHPDVVSGKLAFHGQVEIKLNCYRNELPENGADMVHFDTLHTLLFNQKGWLKPLNRLNRYIQHVYKEKKFETHPDHTAQANFRTATYVRGRCVDEFDMTFYYEGPSMIRVHVDGTMGDINFVLVVATMPIGRLKQRSVFRFYGQTSVKARLFSKLVIWSNQEMLKKDCEVWNHLITLRKQTFVKDDRWIREFRKWFSKFARQQ